MSLVSKTIFLSDTHNYHVDWQSLLGEGSYGKVVPGVHLPSQDLVAIKVANEGRQEDFLRGISIFKMLGSHRNVIPMWDSVCVDSCSAIVFPRIDCDLVAYARTCGDKGRLQADIVRKLGWHMNLGLAYIHSRGIIHRDLHVGNVLVHTSPLRACIADLGFAKALGATCQADQSYTLCAIQFRAPEIMFGAQYGQAIDMWGLGCIIAQMAIGKMVFGHRSDFPSQWGTLVVMASLLGTPCESTWPGLTRLPHFTAHLPKFAPGGLSLIWILCEISLEFTSLCLAYDPAKRLSAMQALEHKYYQTSGVARAHARQHQHNVDADYHPDQTSSCCVPFSGQVAADFLLGKKMDEMTPAYVEQDQS